MYKEFVQKALYHAKHHAIYLWGGQGEKAEDLSYNNVRAREENEVSANMVWRRIQMLKDAGWLTNKTLAFDCSGLVCFLLGKVKRERPSFDMRADDLAKRYTAVNYLAPGVLLHRRGHIAIYIGNQYLVEAKGREYGVTVSAFHASDWDKNYYDPFTSERDIDT